MSNNNEGVCVCNACMTNDQHLDELIKLNPLTPQKLRRKEDHLLGYVQVSTRGRGVKRDPALVVRLVDARTVLHQERHHVHVIIYAGLEKERGGEREIVK